MTQVFRILVPHAMVMVLLTVIFTTRRALPPRPALPHLRARHCPEGLPHVGRLRPADPLHLGGLRLPNPLHPRGCPPKPLHLESAPPSPCKGFAP